MRYNMAIGDKSSQNWEPKLPLNSQQTIPLFDIKSEFANKKISSNIKNIAANALINNNIEISEKKDIHLPENILNQHDQTISELGSSVIQNKPIQHKQSIEFVQNKLNKNSLMNKVAGGGELNISSLAVDLNFKDLSKLDSYFAVFKDTSSNNPLDLVYEDIRGLCKRENQDGLVGLMNKLDKKVAWTNDFIKELEQHEGDLTLKASPNNQEENQNLEINLDEYEHSRCDGDEMMSFTETFKNECIEYFKGVDIAAAKQDKTNEEKSTEKNSNTKNREIPDNRVQKNEKHEEHKSKLNKSEDKFAKESERAALNFKEDQENVREANQRRVSKEMDEKSDEIRHQDQQYFERK